ncbi:MAG: hypothetical protein ACU0CC_12985 [Sagittula sp.]|uniref:hypothetical protein n=1 Tax=unclassified Sagittula TaxID=2624628 RepID=UPI000C2D14A6|nr:MULTISPECIES: hypothetical protein [unclassified Sagittula]AUC54725.1 hypothetical protein CDO87_16775 [Sagittula sp. P11]WHZ33916.1 hypothetical protein QNI11_14865 [Sagittula sp. MA-2]
MTVTLILALFVLRMILIIFTYVAMQSSTSYQNMTRIGRRRMFFTVIGLLLLPVEFASALLFYSIGTP